ncbi:hypothetical protein MRB53_003439 [Persea americana]|uniref:Uncharacterized protein n=1 Tax=Persea americana TaxID=3435 RepID=A0ACC2MXK8_PERAE|nr:hypothetical protein MRB53_003439 [Persea americana]
MEWTGPFVSVYLRFHLTLVWSLATITTACGPSLRQLASDVIDNARSVDALGNQCQLLLLMLAAQRFGSYICLVAPFEYRVGNGPSVVGSVKPNLKF